MPATASPHGVFLTKAGASSFYLAAEGLGGYGLPDDHPNRAHFIREVRGGHEVGSYAISSVAEGGETWLPDVVIAETRRLLTAAGYAPEVAWP